MFVYGAFSSGYPIFLHARTMTNSYYYFRQSKLSNPVLRSTPKFDKEQ